MKGILLASVAVATLVSATSAMAQDKAAGAVVPGTSAQSDANSADTVAVDQSQDIVVTAEKRSERLQDVPRTVDVVTGDTLRKLNFKTFSDIQQLTPGLSLTSKEPNVNSVTLRGVGFDPDSSTSPTVDIYFNETPLDTNSAFRSLYDVDQIEVLRGPQGTLRGRTSPSGAITIGTRRADLNEFDGYFQQTFTTQDGINSQGAIGVPVVPGVLAVRVAGLFDRNDGLGGHNSRTGLNDRDKTESARGSVAFAPTSRLRFDLTYQYLNNRSLATPLLFTLPGQTTDPFLTPADRIGLTTLPAKYNYRAHLVTLGASLDLGGAALNYIGGYQNIYSARSTDIAYGGAIANYAQPQAFNTKSRQWSHELRLTSEGKRFWNFLFGAYYENARSNTDLAQRQVLPFGFVAGANPPLDIAVLDVGVAIPNSGKTYAAFTDQRFDITSKAQFRVGLRYQETDVERDFVMTLSGPILGPVPIISSGISPANRHAKYRQLTGSASFKYDFSRDLTGYVSYGRSYRPGGVIATTATLDEDLLVFKPETSDNYEIGLKGAFADRRVTFAIAVYQQDFRDYLAYTGSYLAVSTAKDGNVDNNVAFTFNADARVRGVEASLAGKLTDRFTLGLSATYNDSKFRNATAPCNDYNGDGVPDSAGAPHVPVGQNVAFCRLSGSLSDQAPWGASINAEYRVPVSGDRSFFVRGVASYVPKRRDPFADVRYDDLLNNSVFVGFSGPKGSYEFSLFAKNLANVSTLTTRGAAQVDYSVFNTGYAVGTPVRPREFGIVGRVAF
ncbi:MAG TPA: TonB-dependent receptor [Sphingomonas sp.]|nr:TonB-dependent receptor [Sphingomonas sp.]